MLAYAFLSLLVSYLLVRIFIHLRSKYKGTAEALPRPISASAQTTTFLHLPGLGLTRSGSDNIDLGNSSKTGNSNGSANVNAKTTGTGSSWTWTKRPWTSISLPSLSLPRVRIPWSRGRRLFGTRGGSTANNGMPMGIGGGGSLLASDDEDEGEFTSTSSKSKNIFRPNPIELLPTSAPPPHPLASPITVSRPSTPRAPRVAVGGAAGSMPEGGSGPGSPPPVPQAMLVPMSPPPAELLVDIGESSGSHVYPPPVPLAPTPAPSVKPTALPAPAIYTPAPRPSYPSHTHNAFAHAAARLATTPPPAPHKRSRSLGGVPVRRLSGGAGSGLRNAVGDSWDREAEDSVDVAEDGGRAGKRARGELLIDFEDAEAQAIVRSTSESTSATSATSASDIGTVGVGLGAPFVPVKPLGPTPSAVGVYGSHPVQRHGWDDDREEDDEDSWKWFARGPPGLVKGAEVVGRGSAFVPVYRSVPVSANAPVSMPMPMPMKTTATATMTTTSPAIPIPIPISKVIYGTTASKSTPALTSTTPELDSGSSSSSMQLIDISLPTGEARLEEGVLVDVSYGAGAYDDCEEVRSINSKLEKQELLVDIEGQQPEDVWTTSAYDVKDVFGGANVWDDDLDVEGGVRLFDDQDHERRYESEHLQQQELEQVHLESSPAASPLRATEAEELELELGSVPMLDLGALHVDVEDQAKDHEETEEAEEEEDELTPVSTRSVLPPSPYLVPLPSFSSSEDLETDVYPDPELLPLPSPTMGYMHSYVPKAGEFEFSKPVVEDEFEDPGLPLLPSPIVDVDVEVKIPALSQSTSVMPEKEIVSPAQITRELDSERESASPPAPPRISLSQTPTPPASPPPIFHGHRSSMKGLGLGMPQLQIPAVVVHQAQAAVNVDCFDLENASVGNKISVNDKENGHEKERDTTPNRTPTGLRPAWSIRAADAPALGIPSPTAGPRKVLGDVSVNANANTTREVVSVEVVKVQKADEDEIKAEEEVDLKVEDKEVDVIQVAPVTEEVEEVIVSPPEVTSVPAIADAESSELEDNTNADTGVETDLELEATSTTAAVAKNTDTPSVPTLEPSTSLPGSFPELVSPSTSIPFPSSSSSSTTTTTATSTSTSIATSTTTISQRIRSASISLRGSGPSPPWSLPSARHIVRSPLDIALAMQMRPGLGAGADPAWMVRFLMAVYGWVLVSIAGGDY